MAWEDMKRYAASAERLAWLRPPDGTIERAVAGLGQIVSVERLGTSFSNDVYAVALTGGDDVMVRVHRGRPDHFAIEAWAIEQARAAGVPVPVVLRREDVGDRSVCVETRVPGDTVQVLLAGEDPSAADVLRQAGIALRRLHSIAVDRWGPLGDGEDQLAGGGLDAMLPVEAAAALVDDYGALGLDPGVLRDAVAVVADARPTLSSVEPRLLHGDLCSDHLLAREGELTGIVDLEFPRGGDPAWDLAYWDHHNRHPESIGWLLAGYGDPSIRARLHAWKVAISIGYVVQHLPRGTLGPGFCDWVHEHLVDELAR